MNTCQMLYFKLCYIDVSLGTELDNAINLNLDSDKCKDGGHLTAH